MTTRRTFATTCPMPIGTALNPGSRRSLASLVLTVSDAMATRMERARERRQLSELDPRMLKDIGLNRADAERESAKPFWQP